MTDLEHQNPDNQNPDNQNPEPPPNAPDGPSKQLSGPPTPAQQQMVQRLVNGEEGANNAFVAYKVDQLKEVAAQHDAMAANIKQGEQQLGSMRQQLTMVSGQYEQSIKDIIHWQTMDDAKGGEHDD